MKPGILESNESRCGFNGASALRAQRVGIRKWLLILIIYIDITSFFLWSTYHCHCVEYLLQMISVNLPGLQGNSNSPILQIKE